MINGTAEPIPEKWSQSKINTTLRQQNVAQTIDTIIAAMVGFIEEKKRDALDVINQRKRPTVMKSIRSSEKISCVQATELNVISKSCAELTCTNCGTHRIREILQSCSSLNSETELITYLKYSTITNTNGRENRQLIKTEATHKAFMQEFQEYIKKFAPHYRLLKIEKFHRQAQFDYFDVNTMIIFCHFASVYQYLSKNELNSNAPFCASQEVFVVTFWQDGEKKTEQWSMWGEKVKHGATYVGLSTNYVFHTKSLKHIIKFYQNEYQLTIKNLLINSDGCPDQYKSKFNVFSMNDICDEFNLDNIIHTYAPTAGFKCICDSAGFTTKRILREGERSGKFRCERAIDCYKELIKLPDIKPKKHDSLNLQSILKRHHSLVVEENMYQEAVDNTKIADGSPDPNVICIPNAGIERERVRDLTNIMKLYQIKYSKSNTPNEVQKYIKVRNDICLCRNCISFDNNLCLEGHKWKKLLFDYKPIRNREHNQDTSS